MVNGWRKKGRREPFSVLFNCATAGSRSARSYAANIDHDDVSVHSRARPLPQHFHAPKFVPAPCPFSFIRLIISKNNLIQLDFFFLNEFLDWSIDGASNRECLREPNIVNNWLNFHCDRWLNQMFKWMPFIGRSIQLATPTVVLNGPSAHSK